MGGWGGWGGDAFWRQGAYFKKKTQPGALIGDRALIGSRALIRIITAYIHIYIYMWTHNGAKSGLRRDKLARMARPSLAKPLALLRPTKKETLSDLLGTLRYDDGAKQDGYRK